MGIRATTARRLTIKIVAQALAERRKLKDTDAHEGERERPRRAPGLAAPVLWEPNTLPGTPA